MLKILSRVPNRDIHIITKPPPEQYSNSKIKTKEISDEIKPLNEKENAMIVFDDILGSPNSRLVDQYFIRGRHNVPEFIIYRNLILICQEEQYEITVTNLFSSIKR